MEITCGTCQGSGSSGGVSCTVCGGDGVIELTDANFKQIHLGDQIAVTGIVWDLILTSLAALVSDMAIIKAQIQALYDDLNP